MNKSSLKKIYKMSAEICSLLEGYEDEDMDEEEDEGYEEEEAGEEEYEDDKPKKKPGISIALAFGPKKKKG